MSDSHKNRPPAMPRDEVLAKAITANPPASHDDGLRQLIEHARLGVYRTTPDGKVLLANEALVSMLGFESLDDLAQQGLECKNGDDSTTRAPFLRRLEADGEIHGYESAWTRHDGSVIFLAENARVVRGEDGEVLYHEGTVEDISARALAQEALRESEAKYRSLIEGLPYGVAIVQHNRIIFANATIAAMLNFDSPDDVVGQPGDFGLAEEDRPRIVPMIRSALEDDGPWPVHFFSTSARSDGSRFPCECFCSRIDYGRQRALQFIIMDITERRRHEKEQSELLDKLHRSRKMEAVGLLASGVAHDLNNILSGIASYPDLLLRLVSDDSELREPLTVIRDSGLRAAAVVHDLLTIARGSASQRKVANLNRIVRDYLSSPELKALATSRPRVTVASNLAEDLGNIECSTVHIRKLLMNLVSNAVEAPEDEGKVVITTENRYLDEALDGYDHIDIGEYVVLSVRDDGPGIDEVHMNRIFEPFFSNKVLGRSGHGLGLAVVWNTVQDHDGYINVTSSPEGSLFEVFLSATRELATEEVDSLCLDSFRGEGQRVLVIDDEKAQRQIVCKMLEQLGYRAEAAASGAEALAFLEKEPADLLVLDMMMPNGWSGRQTYEKILERWPQQRAVISSGYAETEDVKETQRLGAGVFLKKPYRLYALGRALWKELAKPGR